MSLVESLERMLEKFIMYVPNVAGALIILAIGWLLATGLSRLTRRLVDRTSANERLESHELAQPGTKGASRFAGGFVFWAIFLIALGAAADALQVAVVSRTVERLVSYVPRFVVAGVMLTIGVSLANWLKRLIVRRATTSSSLKGTAAQVAVIVLTSFMAARELDIGASILNMAFVLVIGACAVAFAIAFGLGARPTADRIARDWYERRAGTIARPDVAAERPYVGVQRTVFIPRPSVPSQA